MSRYSRAGRGGLQGRWVVLPLCLALLALVAGCGGAAAPSKPAAAPEAATTAAAPTLTLKVDAHAPASDISSKVMVYWGKRVTQATGGHIQFRYYWADSLVPITQVFDAIGNDVTDMGDVAVSFIAGEAPATSILGYPYTFPVATPHMVAFNQAVDPLLNQAYASHGQRVVFSDNGQLPVGIVGRTGLYTSPGSLNGALVRSAGKWQAAALTAWGAKPVVIGLGNLYTALQRGTVDASLLDPELTRSFKMYEVAKYFTLLQSSINYDTMDINNGVWSRLSPAEQKAMETAGLAAEKYGDTLAISQYKSTLATLRSHGMDVAAPPAAVLAQLQASAKTVWPQIQKVQGPVGSRIMQVVGRFAKYNASVGQ